MEKKNNIYLLLRKQLLIIMAFTIIFSVKYPMNVYAEFDSVNEIQKENLYEITPVTNIDDLPGIEVGSDIYYQLKSTQNHLKRTKNTLPNWIKPKFVMLNSTTFRVDYKNIGVDSVDYVLVNVMAYNTNNLVSAVGNRPYYNIPPGTWINENFYVGAKFKNAVINITARDGSVSGTKVYYYNNPFLA